jgi:hypothetical protein
MSGISSLIIGNRAAPYPSRFLRLGRAVRRPQTLSASTGHAERNVRRDYGRFAGDLATSPGSRIPRFGEIFTRRDGAMLTIAQDSRK